MESKSVKIVWAIFCRFKDTVLDTLLAKDQLSCVQNFVEWVILKIKQLCVLHLKVDMHFAKLSAKLIFNLSEQ